mmetsp:Transcript_59/g.53  ORF Transcript_59/g.53 Transcript_59/m.53 type:complete len:334 (-) Transcript_59:318-1319(-)
MHSTTYDFIPEKNLSIVGVAVNEGQNLHGTEKGPDVIREGGLHDVAKYLGWNVKDQGNIENKNLTIEKPDLEKYKYKNIMNATTLGAANKMLHETVYKSAKEGNFNLVLGGDHGIATGSISGMKKAYPDLKVIWIDAHGDCNIPEGSPSGNYHGMPVGHLFGWIPEGTVPGFDWFTPNLKCEDIVYIGLRDMDEFEINMIKKHNVKVYDMDAVTEKGIGKVLEETFEYFNKDGKTHPIHISFDIDGIDPFYAPQTGTRARGGLTDREAHLIIRKTAKTGNLVSMDLVEINPELQKDAPLREILHGDQKMIKGTETVCLGLELIRSALGYRLLL